MLFSQLTNSFRYSFTHPKFTATKYPPCHHAKSRAFKLITILTHSSTHSFTHLYLLLSAAVTSCNHVTAIDGQAEVALHLCVVTCVFLHKGMNVASNILKNLLVN